MKKKVVKTRTPSDDFLKRMGAPMERPASIITSGIREELLFVRPDQIIPFRGQSRQIIEDEELIQLTETIKRHGVRQPLTLLPVEGTPGKYEVVSGERRLRAATLANLDKIPAILIHDEKLAEEIALIENIHRKDLHPIELGQAYHRLYTSTDFASVRDMAAKLSVNASQIAEYRQYANFPPQIINLLLQHNISRRSFLRTLIRTMAAPNAEKQMLELIQLEIKRVPPVVASANNKGAPTPPKKTNILRISLEKDELSTKVGGLVHCSKDTLVKLKGSLVELIEKIDSLI